MLRPQIIAAACELGLKDCLKQAGIEFQKRLSTPEESSDIGITWTIENYGVKGQNEEVRF